MLCKSFVQARRRSESSCKAVAILERAGLIDGTSQRSQSQTWRGTGPRKSFKEVVNSDSVFWPECRAGLVWELGARGDVAHVVSLSHLVHDKDYDATKMVKVSFFPPPLFSPPRLAAVPVPAQPTHPYHSSPAAGGGVIRWSHPIIANLTSNTTSFCLLMREREIWIEIHKHIIQCCFKK